YVSGTPIAIAIGALMPGIAPTRMPSETPSAMNAMLTGANAAATPARIGSISVRAASGQREAEQPVEQQPQHDRERDSGAGDDPDARARDPHEAGDDRGGAREVAEVAHQRERRGKDAYRGRDEDPAALRQRRGLVAR